MESLGSAKVLIKLAMDTGETQRLHLNNKELHSKEGETSAVPHIFPYHLMTMGCEVKKHKQST